MKPIYLFCLIVLTLMSCKQETSLEPPRTTPTTTVPPVATPNDKYLINTISIRYDYNSERDSVRFVYNNKNQMTDLYIDEGAPAYYLYSHQRFLYSDAGKVIKAVAYSIPGVGKEETLSRVDSIGWSSGNQMLGYRVNVTPIDKDPSLTFRFNSNGQISYYDDVTSSYYERYDYQGKDVAKLITADRSGKEELTTYEYNDRINPFYQLFIQNPHFYHASFFLSVYCSFSEHNVVKISTPGSHTEISYRSDPLTGLVLEQRKTVIFATDRQTTTSTFSYIKAK